MERECIEEHHKHFRRDGSLKECRARDEGEPHEFGGKPHYTKFDKAARYYLCIFCGTSSYISYPCEMRMS